MKLIKFSNKYYFLGFLGTLLIAGVFVFYISNYSLNKIYSNQLQVEKEELLFNIKKNPELLTIYASSRSHKISIKKITLLPIVKEVLKDTFQYNSFLKKKIKYKQLFFFREIHNQNYKISIVSPYEFKNILVKNILITILLVIILIFFMLFFMNKLAYIKITKPFYGTLEELKSFNVLKTKKLNLPPTDIFEFQELNSAIEIMISNVEKDYRLLKEYTENVSHEIQTPLAIIKNKIELLLQDQTFNKDHLLTLAKLHQSTGRLSKLSKNLSILTKIENNQFVEGSSLFLSDFIQEILEDFIELMDLKEISLETSYEGNPELFINTTLAYLLFNNLISNAIRHNVKRGKISIKITEDRFVISNTGNPLKDSKIALFNRFVKSSDNSDSTGLGLAMVKKIISFYGFYIAYKNDDEQHVVSVVFIKK